MSDHRRISRTCCALTVQVHAPSEDVLLFTYATNISSDGVYVRANRPLPVGAEVRLELQPQTRSERLKLNGVVVRVADDGVSEPRGIGVAFAEEVRNEQGPALERLLARVDTDTMLTVADAETFTQFRDRVRTEPI